VSIKKYTTAGEPRFYRNFEEPGREKTLPLFRSEQQCPVGIPHATGASSSTASQILLATACTDSPLFFTPSGLYAVHVEPTRFRGTPLNPDVT